MAKTENILDDETGEQITYPYISDRSIRVEISPTKYVWMTTGDLLTFANGKNMGEWVDKRMQEILDEAEAETDY